jgi:hypothetical protein
LAQFCGGRCLQRGKPQNKPDTPENIFRMNLRNICVRTKYFQTTVTELRQTAVTSCPSVRPKLCPPKFALNCCTVWVRWLALSFAFFELVCAVAKKQM